MPRLQLIFYFRQNACQDCLKCFINHKTDSRLQLIFYKSQNQCQDWYYYFNNYKTDAKTVQIVLLIAKPMPRKSEMFYFIENQCQES